MAGMPSPIKVRLIKNKGCSGCPAMCTFFRHSALVLSLEC